MIIDTQVKTILASFFLIAFLCSGVTYGDKISLTTKQLRQLDRKISRLQQTLNNSKDKRETLEDELQLLDKNIASLTLKSTRLKTSIGNKQESITALQQQEDKLAKKLSHQQAILSRQLTSHYQLGHHQYLQLLLNQQQPSTISRALNYYRYIYQARREAIQQVKTTNQLLIEKKSQLTDSVNHLKRLKADYASQQSTLLEDKKYQQSVMQQLEKQISTGKHRLANYQANKQRLESLLQNLKKQRSISVKRPFYKMRHKLPWPTKGKVTQRYNQVINQIPSNGITIDAPEGQNISAIYAGKIVFADWLKGYGLLIIIDHGNGYMSLYAHNQSLYKESGDNVSEGELIATVGHSGGLKQNSLYFEIRRNGKPSDPLQWLT